jgi:hypothetical protein
LRLSEATIIPSRRHGIFGRSGRRRARYDRRGHDQQARGGLSLGAVLTGLMVAVGATALLSILVGQGLQMLDYDVHRVARGESFFVSLGAGIGVVVAALLSFMWGGYAAGRMARGRGALNGALVPILAILGTATAGYLAVGVRSLKEVTFPFGVGTLPLDGNLTPLGMGVVAAFGIAIVAGGTWGGIVGARWHSRPWQTYEPDADDSFTDLREAPDQPWP